MTTASRQAEERYQLREPPANAQERELYKQLAARDEAQWYREQAETVAEISQCTDYHTAGAVRDQPAPDFRSWFAEPDAAEAEAG